jgi:hypothetical protein
VGRETGLPDAGRDKGEEGRNSLFFPFEEAPFGGAFFFGAKAFIRRDFWLKELP